MTPFYGEVRCAAIPPIIMAVLHALQRSPLMEFKLARNTYGSTGVRFHSTDRTQVDRCARRQAGHSHGHGPAGTLGAQLVACPSGGFGNASDWGGASSSCNNRLLRRLLRQLPRHRHNSLEECVCHAMLGCLMLVTSVPASVAL